MEEQPIKDLWIKSKCAIEPIFNSFKYIEIPTELSSKVAQSSLATPMAPDNHNIVEMDDKEGEQIISHNQVNVDLNTFKRANSFLYAKLLSESDINKVKDKFYEDAQNVLDEAMRKHHNISTGGNSMWLYVILVYFAYDDIFRMLANPIFFYPIMFIISLVGMMYSMGLAPVIVPVGKGLVN